MPDQRQVSRLVRGRGTTLLELMVVCFVFLLLMSVILGFYVYATRVTRHRDEKSATYRRVAICLDKCELQLANARVYAIRVDQVIFTLPLEKNPVRDRCTAWDPDATLLQCLPGDRVVLRRKGATVTLCLLQPGERVVFTPGPQYVDVIYNGPPVVSKVMAMPGEAESQFQIARRVLIEKY